MLENSSSGIDLNLDDSFPMLLDFVEIVLIDLYKIRKELG
jgi:hypothetical protein